MTGFIVFGVVIAVVLFTSLIKNVTMSTKVKNAIAAVLSVVTGVVIDLSGRGFDFGSYGAADVLGTVLVIYGGSQAIYNFLLSGTTLDAKLEQINGPKPDDNKPETYEGF